MSITKINILHTFILLLYTLLFKDDFLLEREFIIDTISMYCIMINDCNESIVYLNIKYIFKSFNM